jgi:hypothetical protein
MNRSLFQCVAIATVALSNPGTAIAQVEARLPARITLTVRIEDRSDEPITVFTERNDEVQFWVWRGSRTIDGGRLLATFPPDQQDLGSNWWSLGTNESSTATVFNRTLPPDRSDTLRIWVIENDVGRYSTAIDPPATEVYRMILGELLVIMRTDASQVNYTFVPGQHTRRDGCQGSNPRFRLRGQSANYSLVVHRVGTMRHGCPR